MSPIDPALLKPGEHAPVPQTRDELLIEALRFANRVSGFLNDLAARARSSNGVDALLRRRFSDCSGVHLFIAANNLRIELPHDLNGERDDE